MQDPDIQPVSSTPRTGWQLPVLTKAIIDTVPGQLGVVGSEGITGVTTA
jgi:hypothetical protein